MSQRLSHSGSSLDKPQPGLPPPTSLGSLVPNLSYNEIKALTVEEVEALVNDSRAERAEDAAYFQAEIDRRTQEAADRVALAAERATWLAEIRSILAANKVRLQNGEDPLPYPTEPGTEVETPASNVTNSTATNNTSNDNNSTSNDNSTVIDPPGSNNSTDNSTVSDRRKRDVGSNSTTDNSTVSANETTTANVTSNNSTTNNDTSTVNSTQSSNTTTEATTEADDTTEADTTTEAPTTSTSTSSTTTMYRPPPRPARSDICKPQSAIGVEPSGGSLKYARSCPCAVGSVLDKSFTVANQNAAESVLDPGSDAFFNMSSTVELKVTQYECWHS